VPPLKDGGAEVSTSFELPAISDTDRKTGRYLGSQSGKEPMQKIMMRLPQSLAQEFRLVYLKLARRHLRTHGKKLLLQDCHIEMVREWIERQKQFLAE
jgi:hypothetical protein